MHFNSWNTWVSEQKCLIEGEDWGDCSGSKSACPRTETREETHDAQEGDLLKLFTVNTIVVQIGWIPTVEYFLGKVYALTCCSRIWSCYDFVILCVSLYMFRSLLILAHPCFSLSLSRLCFHSLHPSKLQSPIELYGKMKGYNWQAPPVYHGNNSRPFFFFHNSVQIKSRSRRHRWIN